MDQLEMEATGRSPSQDLRPYLGRIRWRLRLRDGLNLAQSSLWKAGLISLLALLAGRIWPIEQPWRWALLPLAAWFIGVLGYALFRPLSMMRVASQVDLELNLKERLSTSLALEKAVSSPVYQSFEPHLVEKAHDDALHAARQVYPTRDFPLRAQRRSILWSGAILAAAVVLLVLPNPMDALIEERKAVEEEAARQAERIEQVREQVEGAEEMTPEEREELLRRLSLLADQLRANPGDREQALADLSRLEESLRLKLDPKGAQRQAAMDAMAAQLQAMARSENPQIGDLEAAAEALKELAEMMQQMSEEERQAMAQQLAQMAARAAQAGDSSLAQALSALAQASQNGDAEGAQEAAERAAEAMRQAQSEMANQRTFSQTLSQLQNSRQRMAGAGQPGQQAQQGQDPGEGEGQGQGEGEGEGQGQGQSQGQGQGQQPGQGQGQSPGGGGGTTANNLPPSTSSGSASDPTGEGRRPSVGSLDGQVYVPFERQGADGEDLFIPGQDTDQGETQTREQRDPMGGLLNPSLVPYESVYQNYVDAASRAMDQSYIPPGLKDYIREYFSQLEP